MNVLFVQTQLAGGGALRLLVDRARTLRTLGCDVSVASLFSFDQDPQLQLSLERLNQVGAHVMCLERQTRPAVATLRELVATIRDRGIQVVHNTHHIAEIYGGVAGIHTGAIVTREFIGQHTLHHRLLLRRRLHHSSLAISPSIARRLVDEGVEKSAKVRVSYPPFDGSVFRERVATVEKEDTRQRLGLCSGEPVILFVGRAHRDKGVLLLPAIAAALRELGFDARFVVVGDGPDLRELRQAISRTPLARRFTLLGSRIDTERFFAIADVFVAPTLHEASVSYAMLEATAAGVPLLASRLPEIEAVLEHGRHALLVEPTDARAWAEGVVAVLSDPGSAATRAQTAFDHVSTTYPSTREEAMGLLLWWQELSAQRRQFGGTLHTRDVRLS